MMHIHFDCLKYVAIGINMSFVVFKLYLIHDVYKYRKFVQLFSFNLEPCESITTGELSKNRCV